MGSRVISAVFLWGVCAVSLLARDLSDIERELKKYTPEFSPIAEAEEPSFKWANMSLESFSEIAKEYGVDMLVSPACLGKQVNLSLRNMSFAEALPLAIQSANVHWLYDSGRVIVFEDTSELKRSFASQFKERLDLEEEQAQVRIEENAKEAEKLEQMKRAQADRKSTISPSGYIALDELIIGFEDGADLPIYALFEGPNRTPYDLAVIHAGPWTVNTEGLAPDDYTLTLYADGYAEQRLRVTYKDGQFVAFDEGFGNELLLFKKRYITFEIVWNSAQSPELTGVDVMREIVCATHQSRHRVIGPDFLIVQTLSEPLAKQATVATGLTPALRQHRFSNFFGVVYPEPNEEFDDADLAPDNDLYQGAGMISLEPGKWFYLRISGHVPTTIAYLKMRVLNVGLVPDGDAMLLEESEPRWKKARELADRLGIQLPDS